MKNSILITLILCLTLMTSCAQDKVIAEADLPNEIKSFITTHFPNNAVTRATMETEMGSDTYEVKLKENIQLDFNSTFEITDIDANSELPASVIPKMIVDYVKANYTDNVITDWELDDNNQEVELDNGVNLEFNMNGEFIREDS